MFEENENKNELNSSSNMRDFMATSFNDNKADKSKELNSDMSIMKADKSQDEYTRTIHNIGGNN